MSSHASREEERRLSIGTLAIASIASATAALITSQFWQGGTPIAAAITPLLVALVSEMLHRPATKIAERMTVDRAALPAEAGEPGPEASVYRSTERRRASLSPKVVAITAALAFVIGVAVLTLPELVAGQSLGNSDRPTTLFSTEKRADGQSGSDRREAPPVETEPSDQPQDTTEDTEAETQPQTAPEEEPAEPETTEPAPRPKQAPPQSTPEPEPPAPSQPGAQRPAP